MDEFEQCEEIAEQLEEKREQLLSIVEEVKMLVNQIPSSNIQSGAKLYWLAQLEIQLGGEHSYLGGSMCTMENTIDALNEY